MARPVRLRGYSRKPSASGLPPFTVPWAFTVDVGDRPRAYLEFHDATFLGRRPASEETDAEQTAALGADYFLLSEPEAIPPATFTNAYSATFSNKDLAPAIVTALQLGIRARFALIVEPTRACNFLVASDRDIEQILARFFHDTRPISPREYTAIHQGRLRDARWLSHFTLPELPGLEDATPLPVDLPELGEGLVLGQALGPFSRAPVGPAVVQIDRLARGTLVTGTVGSGKTNAVMRLIDQASPHASVLVFDPKCEYRSLFATHGAAVFGFAGDNLLSHNLLKPEGSPSRWVKQFADIFSEIIAKNVKASGSKDVIVAEMDGLFRENGVYDGSANYPHIGDLAQKLEGRAASSERERNWIASALRVLKTLQVGRTGDAFCVREGLSLERLLRGNVVVETDGIGDAAGSALFVSVLLQKIRNHLSTSDAPGLRHLVVIEEAQNVLARDEEATAVLTTTAREIRAYGVGMVYVTQVPSEFSKDALSTANTIISTRLSHPEDTKIIGQMLGLRDEGLLSRLPVGQAFVRTDRLQLVQIPQANRPKVHDSQLQPVRVEREEVAHSFAQRTAVEHRLERLGELERRILVTICCADAVTPTDVGEFLSMDRKDVGRPMAKMAGQGFFGHIDAQTGQPGRPPAIYFLRPFGEEAFRQLAGRYPDRKQEPSPNHAQVVERVVRSMSLRAKPPGRFDILYETPDGDRAIEVETGSNKDVQLDENVRKSVALQGEAVFVATDERTFNRVLQAGARYTFDRREALRLKIALIDGLPEWQAYEFQPIPSIP